MTFQKGHTINVGKKYSEERKKKIGDANRGKTFSYKPRLKTRGRIPWNKGIEMPEEFGKKVSLSKTGAKYTQEHRKKMSESHKKIIEKHHSWKGGITPLNEKIRKSIEYRLWRESVFKRDNYICIWCRVKGGILNADHIKPFSLFPELRFAIDNGRTLCEQCHRKTDTWGASSKKIYK